MPMACKKSARCDRTVQCLRLTRQHCFLNLAPCTVAGHLTCIEGVCDGELKLLHLVQGPLRAHYLQRCTYVHLQGDVKQWSSGKAELARRSSIARAGDSKSDIDVAKQVTSRRAGDSAMQHLGALTATLNLFQKWSSSLIIRSLGGRRHELMHA